MTEGSEVQSERAPRWARAVEYGRQPALLAAALLVWLPNRDRPDLFLFVVVAAQGLLGVLEHFLPARPDWVQRSGEKLANLGLVVGFTACAGAVTALYRGALSEPLGELRAGLGLDLWPSRGPLAARVALAFLASEVVWYWIHRSEHRFAWLWRVSGHGLHHSFQRLNAIRLNARGIGWLLTTNTHHLRHHSRVFEESNTNYGCAAIVWDRVFGTFAPGAVRETGIGPSKPRLWQKLLLPIRQPGDVTVAP